MARTHRKQSRHGRPVLGTICGILFGLFLSLTLNSVLYYVFTAAGLVLGLVLGLTGPFGRNRRRAPVVTVPQPPPGRVTS